MKISNFELGVASQVYQVALPYSHHLLLLSLKEKITIDFYLYYFLILPPFLFTKKKRSFLIFLIRKIFADLSLKNRKKTKKGQERGAQFRVFICNID